MGVNSLPKTVTRQRRDCDLNPGPSAPESSTLTARLPSHPKPMHYGTVHKQTVRDDDERSDEPVEDVCDGRHVDVATEQLVREVRTAVGGRRRGPRHRCCGRRGRREIVERRRAGCRRTAAVVVGGGGGAGRCRPVPASDRRRVVVVERLQHER